MSLPLALYVMLFAGAVFLPLRWAIASYLALSTVDFYTGHSGVGILNALKGLVYPVFLLWRLRAYAGHSKTIVAPVAWLLLVSYAAIASFWSFFPLSAVKLVGEMVGSFLICLALLRASKGGYLSQSLALPVTFAILVIACLRSLFAPGYGDTPDRFTAFTSAQTFAALLAALFALALSSITLKPWTRILSCLAIATAMVLDGSRLWLLGLILIVVTALVVSSAPAWIKICSFGAIVLVAIGLIATSDRILGFLAQRSRSSRVASILTALYEGNQQSSGLGTFIFRRQLNGRTLSAIGSSTATELLFGHGTSNGRLLLGNLNKGIGDPNRSVHNEWLRILYEWGIFGLLLWFAFIGSVALFAWRGVLHDSRGYAKPLFVYLPAFALALFGENILAGAGHAENIGFVLLIAIASISYRRGAVSSTQPVAGRHLEHASLASS